MKKVIKLGRFLILVALTIAPASSEAFNPLAHIYIAENACSSCGSKIDCYYGSVAPDMVWYLTDPVERDNLGADTHVNHIDLTGFSWGSTQMAFAIGWLTHGQNPLIRGADYFAHIDYKNSIYAGYVIDKAQLLLSMDPTGELTPEFAHYIIEATIDILLKGDDPTLPGKLFFANLFRSWQDRSLMMRVFVWIERDTDWLKFATAELTFRQLVNRYAIALMLPEPYDEAALAQLGAELAKEMFGIPGITSEMLLEIYHTAIDLCESDYYGVIAEAIGEIYSP